jgi:hypothetical protein
MSERLLQNGINSTSDDHHVSNDYQQIASSESTVTNKGCTSRNVIISVVLLIFGTFVADSM